MDFHADLGQMFIVKVGKVEDMPPVPDDLPRCGDWSPSTHAGQKVKGTRQRHEEKDSKVSGGHGNQFAGNNGEEKEQ